MARMPKVVHTRRLYAIGYLSANRKKVYITAYAETRATANMIAGALMSSSRYHPPVWIFEHAGGRWRPYAWE